MRDQRTPIARVFALGGAVRWPVLGLQSSASRKMIVVKMPWMPASINVEIGRWIIGLSKGGASCFEAPFATDHRREPDPPASTIPFMSEPTL